MADGVMHYGASDVMVEGQRKRTYILDCPHATTQVTLDRTADDDAEVLPHLLWQHREAVHQGVVSGAPRRSEDAPMPEECVCIPKGWITARRVRFDS